jgi:RNA polymerase sigma-70 factor (sigma-E family)
MVAIGAGLDVSAEETTSARTLDEAYASCFGVAYKVAYRILGQREDAEDVAAEALARAQLRWSRLADHPEPWVSTVASRLSIDRWRHLRRARSAPQDAPGRADAFALERVDLVRALEALPRRQRTVVVLRYLADRPEAEVAAALGCSVSTVRTHASRGLASLHEALGGNPSDRTEHPHV